ncbi:hypothetical protein K501DRAFT_282785 [Backusella circina FSU 941]|nr:hypothetical protein K501DRAFT_282785 [Backusella circina FSU 941]
MPNIKPYPHQEPYTDMSQKHHSVYRPAYHRTPTTSKTASRQNKEAWNSSLPEASPIVVPSMSTPSVQSHYLDFYQSNANLYYATSISNYYPQMQTVYRNSTNTTPNYHQAISHSNIVMHQLPIHHTLENATITYDTTDQSLQKELVKDVFFSPAMVTSGRKLSPASSYSSIIDSVCATSDSESDSCTVSTSPETPSDLLDENQDCLFDFGLDLATTSSTTLSNTSSYEEVIMAAEHKKKLTFTLPDFENTAFQLAQQNDFLPTPPASGEEDYTPCHSMQNKRRCSDSVLQDRMKKKQRTNVTGRLREHRTIISSTPPLSPPMKKKSFFGNDDCFEDASGEDSSDSDSERSFALDSLEHNRFACDSSVNLNAAPEFQLGSVFDSDDDSSSTGSWEEISEKQQAYLDSASEDEDTFEKTISLPKKYKKLAKASITAVSKSTEENLQLAQESNVNENLPKAPPRPTAQPTIYQKLTKANIDWCRYCGTTEGVNWRPGPWGKRTLCNKHGCDYKGYGFACKLPRLDLTGFTKESIDDRDRPVLQLYCTICHQKDSWEGNVLIRCEGCPKAYHQKCLPEENELTEEFIASKESWYCDSVCCENTKRKRIVVELPRKRLPLMCAPKNSGTSSDLTPRTRSLRETASR